MKNVFFHSLMEEKHVLVPHVVTWMMLLKEVGVQQKLMKMVFMSVAIMVIAKEHHVSLVRVILSD